MTEMRLKTITAHELSKALSALDVPIGVALKDPVRLHALRLDRVGGGNSGGAAGRAG